MQAIVYMIPIAVAVAFSSVPITLAIFILLSPQRTRSAVPFLIGWVAGIVIVVSGCALLAQAVPTPRSPRQSDTAIGVTEIVLGIALIAVAVFSWIRKSRKTARSMPMPFKSIRKLGPWSSLGIGFILNLRPKGLLLAVAGGLAVRADADSLAQAVAAIAVYTLIGASTVTVPIIAVTIAPERTEPTLVRTQEWLVRNAGTITSAVLLIVAVVVIAMGIQRL